MYRNGVLKGQANNIDIQYNMFETTITQQSWFQKVISLYVKYKLMKLSPKAKSVNDPKDLSAKGAVA